MKKKKNVVLKEESKKFWSSLYWITNTLENYFEGRLTSLENKKIEQQLNDISEKTLGKEAENLSRRELTKADHKIKINVFKQLQLPLDKREKPLYTSIGYPKYAVIAAIFLLLIGLSYWGFNPKSAFRQQYFSWTVKPELLFQTSDSQLASRILSDGTKIYLNGNSRLSYKAGAFNKKTREVWLTGEAFFQVVHNPEKPFIIHSPDGLQTKVLGTSFNVKAYPGLNEQVISVRTGKVKITGEKGQMVQITPNQKAVFNNKNHTLETRATDGELAASWRNGNIVFDYAGKDEITLRLRQKFEFLS